MKAKHFLLASALLLWTGVLEAQTYQVPVSDKNEKMLESPEYMVYSCVGLYPKSVGQLTEETKLRPEEVLKLLVSLELQGYIREISKNYYIKVK